MKAWVENAAVKPSMRQRRDVIRNWVLGNGLLSSIPDTHSLSEEEKTQVWIEVYRAAEHGVSALRNGKLDPYQSINNLINYMQKRGGSPTTISAHKFKVVKLYRYLKFELDEDDLKDAVKKVDAVTVTDDRNLTRDEIRTLLIHGNAKQKALVSFLVSTGARIGEAVQVRISDIDFAKKPVTVYFSARKTKTKRKRFSFLSSECVDLLRAQISDQGRIRGSEWLFPGWIPGRERDTQADKHMSPSSAYLQIRKVMALAGLVPPPGKHKNRHAGSQGGAHLAYHPHVLRSTSLEITKSAGYPTDWAEFVVGHDLGTQESYLPSEDKMGKEWLKRCEPAFCFLRPGTEGEVEVEINKRLERATEEMKDWTKQKVDELFKQKGKPQGKPFNVLKILTSDEEAYSEAISNGYEEAGRINGSIIMKRKVR